MFEKANQFELLVILEADFHDNASFWAHCATEFKANPNVFFALPTRPEMTHAIRATGATQPISVGAGSQVDDANVIYEVRPRYATMRTDRDRWDQFSALSEKVPVLATGLDPELDRDAGECAAFPSDPADASRLVEDTLAFFDTQTHFLDVVLICPGQNDYGVSVLQLVEAG